MDDSIDNPDRAVEKAKTLVADWHKEHIIGIYLNSRLAPTKIELVALGGLDQVYVHPREIFRPALVNHAVRVILLHNHPSGQVDPSDEDLSLATQLVKAGKILGIPLVDFIIFASDGDYYSFRRHDLLAGGGDGV